MLSKEFLRALTQSEVPLHKIAWQAGLTPNQVYRITCGIERPGPGSKKVEALCRYLGFDIEEAFDTTHEEASHV